MLQLALDTQLTWAAAPQGKDSMSTSFSSSSCTAVARMGTLWGDSVLTARAYGHHSFLGHRQPRLPVLLYQEQLLCQTGQDDRTFQAQICCDTLGCPSVLTQA